jgi:polyhydroxyalkanoate synthesis repressor PhaR
MARLIKRYGSRKLYDTQESRYISLEEIAQWVRDGEEIKVVDNASSEDVTALTLTQVISEESRKKSQFLSSDLLHDLIRAGETKVRTGVKHLQDGVEGFAKKALDRLVPVSTVREEMNLLRSRLEELERALAEAEAARETREADPVPEKKRRVRKRSARPAGEKTRRPRKSKSTVEEPENKTRDREEEVIG